MELLRGVLRRGQSRAGMVTVGLTDVTQQAVGGALAHVPAVPGSSAVANAAQGAANVTVETGVNMASDAATAAITAKVNGEQQAE